jgi:hypothetical protein
MPLKGHLLAGGLVGPLAGIESGNANDLAGFDGAGNANTRSLTNLLDAIIGDSEGAILKRGSSEWEKLDPADGYLKNASGVLSWGAIATPTAGTPLVMNPYVTSTTTTAQAHGLGVVPFDFVTNLECLTADIGYSVGDVVCGRFINFDIVCDATNFQIVTGTVATSLFRKDTHATSSFTASRWKLTVTPYKLT